MLAPHRPGSPGPGAGPRKEDKTCSQVLLVHFIQRFIPGFGRFLLFLSRHLPLFTLLVDGSPSCALKGRGGLLCPTFSSRNHCAGLAHSPGGRSLQASNEDSTGLASGPEFCCFKNSAAFSSAFPPLSSTRLMPSAAGSFRKTSRQSVRSVPGKGSPPMPMHKECPVQQRVLLGEPLHRSGCQTWTRYRFFLSCDTAGPDANFTFSWTEDTQAVGPDQPGLSLGSSFPNTQDQGRFCLHHLVNGSSCERRRDINDRGCRSCLRCGLSKCWFG